MKINPVTGLAIKICNTCPYLEKECATRLTDYDLYRCQLTGSIKQVTPEMAHSGLFRDPAYEIMDDCQLRDFIHETKDAEVDLWTGRVYAAIHYARMVGDDDTAEYLISGLDKR